MTIVRSPIRSPLRSPGFSPLSGAYSGGGDLYFSQVKLLLGMNGVNGATTTTDESPVGRAMTFVGNAKLDTSWAKYGSSSLLLDGSGDALTAAVSTDFNFGNQPFTGECTVRFAAAGATDGAFMGQWGIGSAASWYFSLSGGNLRFRMFDGTVNQDVAVAWAPTQNVAYQLAFDHDSSRKLRIYRDGAMVASGTLTGSMNASAGGGFGIGQIPSFPGVSEMNGWIDEVRITKGIARIASDLGYPAPSAPFPRS